MEILQTKKSKHRLTHGRFDSDQRKTTSPSHETKGEDVQDTNHIITAPPSDSRATPAVYQQLLNNISARKTLGTLWPWKISTTGFGHEHITKRRKRNQRAYPSQRDALNIGYLMRIWFLAFSGIERKTCRAFPLYNPEHT